MFRLGLLLALNHDNVVFNIGLLPYSAKQTIEKHLILISDIKVASIVTHIKYIVLSSDIKQKTKKTFR